MLHRYYSPSFMASVVMHFFVLLLLIVSFEFNSAMPVLENSDKDMNVINAIVMDSPAPPKPQVVQPIAPPVVQPVEKPQPPAPPPPPQPSAQELAQQQKLQQLQAQEEAIALNIQHQKEKALADQKALAEKQLLADVKKQEEKQKKLKQQALAKSMEKELKAQAAKSLQQQFMQEAPPSPPVSGAKAHGVVDKYKALILQAIAVQWRVPAGVDKTLSAELMIRVAPGGSVQDVEIARSSGDPALDRSARDAVYKASPLPVPANADEFEPFRQFVLKVKPQNLVPSDA